MSDEADERVPAGGYLAPQLADIHPGCNLCIAGYFPDAGSKQGFCRHDPPKVTSMLIGPAVQGGPPRDLNLTAWPIVFRDNWCISGFKLKQGSTR